MEIKQQIKLSQQLVMTPQLQQAIRLLQLSRLELIDEIRKELDANPVLSDDEGERPPAPQPPGDGPPPMPENGALLSDERLGLSERLSERTRSDELQRAKDEKTVQRIMQEWDPVGACTRDLRECLRVQAEVFGCDDLELTIIDKHLHNLEKHNYQAIARDLKVPVEEVYEAVKEIQKLESRPARNFSETDDKTIAITPDVYVIKDSDKFVVTDNDPGVQRLYINEPLTN